MHALASIIWVMTYHHFRQLDFEYLFDHSTLTGENKVLAGRAGAIDAVVAAMRTHVGNAGVSQYACWAMSNICINGVFGV